MSYTDKDHDPDHEQKKQSMKLLGLVLLLVGGVVLVFGVIQLIDAFSAFSDISDIESGFPIGDFFVSMIITIVGFLLFMFGIQMSFLSRAGGISRYFARESAPAARIMTEAIGEGLSKGFGTGSGKEVVKVRCPNCNYLESEDAVYCSKCAAPMGKRDF
jgi:hypothetical protein